MPDGPQPPDPFGLVEAGSIAVWDMYGAFRRRGAGMVEAAVIVAAHAAMTLMVTQAQQQPPPPQD